MSILTVGSAVIGPIGSLLQGSDPAKDAQRKARADSYFRQALQGDAYAEAALRCMAGVVTPLAPPDAKPDACATAGGSAVGRAYAQLKVKELDARNVVADTLVNVAGGALQGADAVRPGAVQDAFIERFGGVSTLLILAVVVVGGVWLMTRKS